MNLGYGRLAEDEYFVVGTEDGLKQLMQSCETAINEGEDTYQNNCEICGVKKVNKEYFEEKDDTFKNKIINKVLGFIFLSLFFASLVVGFITIVKWIFK
jgi:phosphopentomutase